MNPSPSSFPKHKGKPIRRILSLAKALDCTPQHLQYVSSNASNLFRIAKVIPKSDGTIRHTYDAKPLLKNLHRRIKSEILDRVSFPSYLTGCIKGRDYKTNAELHKGAVIVISEDIASFFASTTTEQIFDIWRNFFRFTDDVAACLTSLTTYNGELPQGAITSPHLANLIFWRDEPMLYDRLADEGITYSRFVDDVAVSSSIPLTTERKTEVVSSVYGLILRNGYLPKRRKHELKTSRQRMTVTKLTINQKPGIPKQERAKIRAAVHSLEVLAVKIGQPKELLLQQYIKVMGKVNHLARFHPGEAQQLKTRLLTLKSTLNS